MASNNEAKIKFSADVSDFNSSIKEAKDETKQLNAEMRLNEATFKNTGDSAEYLANKHNLLEQKLKANQQQQEALNAKLDAATQYFGEDSEEVAKLEMQLTNAETAEQRLLSQLNDCNTAIEEQVSGAESNTSALDSLTQTISDQETELASLKDEYVNAVLEYGETSDQAQNLASQITDLSSELSNNKNALEEARTSADQFDESIDDMSGVVGDLPGPLGDIAGGVMDISNAFMTGGIIGLMGELVEKAIEVGQAAWEMMNEFQEAEASIVSGTGLIGEELDALTDKAYEAAAAVAGIDGKDMSEVIAELNTRLGLTGDEAAQAGEMIAKFAKVNGEDAIPAVDDLVDVMHRYGLEVDDLPMLMEKLTVAQQATQLSASDMMGYLEKSGGQFQELGYNLDESLGYLMAFADYTDVSAAASVTGLRNAVSNLSAVTNDVPGSFQQAIDIMQSGAEMSTILNTEVGNTGKTIEQIFGKKATQEMVQAFQYVGTDGIDVMTGKVQTANGALTEQYEATVTAKEAIGQMGDMSKLVAREGITGFNSFVEKQGTTVYGTSQIIQDANGNIKSSYGTMWDSVENDSKNGAKTVKSSFDSIDSNVSSNTRTTADSLSDVSDEISDLEDEAKSLSRTKWGLSKPRLPKISTRWRSEGGTRIPSFSVGWHAAGGVFNQPTLLQSANGNLHGVGEAGPEAIAPISTLKDYMIDAVHQVDFGIDYNLLADRIAGAIAGMSMTVDGTALVGAIAGPMDNALGKIQNRRGRGR